MRQRKWLFLGLFILSLISLFLLFLIFSNQKKLKNNLPVAFRSSMTADHEEATNFDELISSLTLVEKVDQLFLVPSDQASSEATYGGYLLLAKDFANKDPSAVQRMIDAWQAQSHIPLLIAVDEEGGTVNRVSQQKKLRSEPFSSPQKIILEGGLSALTTDTLNKAVFLKNLGINLNLAPVVDLSPDPKHHLYGRTFGLTASESALATARVIQAMKQENLGSTLKHFPGLGQVPDTHQQTVTDLRPPEDFWQNDFLPFVAGIENGADLLMFSHNLVPAFDPNFPASLSPFLHQLARQDLGFTGVIVTDDLNMHAISDHYSSSEAAVLAIEAGNDLLCFTKLTTEPAAIVQAVHEGRITEKTIDQSLERILTLKKKLNLL